MITEKRWEKIEKGAENSLVNAMIMSMVKESEANLMGFGRCFDGHGVSIEVESMAGLDDIHRFRSRLIQTRQW